MPDDHDAPALLLVANWDSDVGYAWWLMESFWAALASHYHPATRVVLAYPSISRLPRAIAEAPLQTVEHDFRPTSLRAVGDQCRFLRRHRVRAIYFSDRATWHWRYLVYRLCGVRLIIVHDHTPGVRSVPTGPKRWIKTMVHRLPWVTADGLIGATPFVRQRFIDVNQAPARRCHVAPNGLPALADPSPPTDVHALFSIPAHRRILVMTGRANRYKGIDFVLDLLVALTRDGRDDVHFLFCGAGPDLDHFRERAAALGVASRVTFAGRRSDIPALLPGCDAAIHPSLGEVGYSLSILEYLRAGLPVLVPDNPSVCGATEHEVTGLVYPTGDVHAAAAALVRLLDDPPMARRMGEAGRLKVESEFTLTATHRALLNAFRCIDRHGRLPAPRPPRWRASGHTLH
jgi:glycosyltransferase involved in cell wall biosynthesis